jgi:hypothetical protein
MKYYTSFMCNINTCAFYTLAWSVLIISINKVWIVCEIDKISRTHLILSLWNYHKHICNWYNSKPSIHISIFIKELKSLLSADNN